MHHSTANQHAWMLQQMYLYLETPRTYYHIAALEAITLNTSIHPPL